MKNLHPRLLPFIATLSVVTLLAACEPVNESSSPWVKSDSPWGKRTAAVTDSAEAPAADAYKQELANIDAGTSGDMELGYQAEAVTSSVPAEEFVVEEIAPAPVAKPVVAKQPKPEKAAPVAVAEASDAGGDFRNIAGNYYTVQVIASVDEKSVYAFASKHQLSTRYIVPTVRGGTTWHVLLLDVYPTKAAAKSALEYASGTLPTKPWIRTVASVQQLMP